MPRHRRLVALGCMAVERGLVRHSAIWVWLERSFPLLVSLLEKMAEPAGWPSWLEVLVTQSLMGWNVSTTMEVLSFAGIPAIQHGSLIEISTGVVGVDEACSGIRSLQATLMISLFFGELYSLTVKRRLGLM